jgi:hypothetical protein
MGKLVSANGERIIDEVKPTLPPTHWATWANAEGGELFNGTQGEAVSVLINFLKTRGMSEGFECGMGKRQEETVN